MYFPKLNSLKINYDFHVAKNARIKYEFDQSLFSINGDLIIANFYQARILSEKINSKRKAEGAQTVTPGQLNALGILHEVFHYLIRIYEEKENPNVFMRAVNHIKMKLGEDNLNNTLLEYINNFPPLNVYNRKISPQDYLNGSTNNKSNKEIILEELILLNLENNNPATVSLEELYSDKFLINHSRYGDLINETENFFITEKPFGPDNLPLTQFLIQPIKNNPYNIEEQLDFLREMWGVFIYDKFSDRILSSKDLIHEDYKLFVHHGGGEKGTPPVPVYKFDPLFFENLKAKIASGEKLSAEEAQFYYTETEQFTVDVDWMPQVVMMAKNIFVWLDQLSKKYSREIRKLNQIPDEELDNLARWNFTALWLIGIWERSSASQKIKHFTGNPEAVSSAYSLYDYVIANEIGGEDAFQNLKDRCWRRGIRLSSDMVPNHTGIYSKWVVEKPDYFVQSNLPPYPGYTFNGPNLSDDQRVEVRIEDKYYNRSDAAVVFQRKDSFTGDIRYIYHGNDGTHMPWNDTAQLNLLSAEVRESLIQTIMHVARKTPIIRFDAAMTLAKKHFQRLWFPQPGTGGAVPSRSDYAMTRATFDEVMPVEFWREVVDRINTEMPQTLLLAEAFWLMEGYFVRTLGMHRVYNSAFMHMMMKEENDKYRELIKNTLEFNPEILKRYVNFMSNPDEETAVNQFGKGDKYFGVCMLMITMPGLPMFAHGQIEGFAEKYGMEYKRAYYDEFADDNLMRRHQSEIFPLSQKRYLFSQVHNFELYDFIANSGEVNENVYAFSNRVGDERAIVIYNNSYEECIGTIHYSSKKASASGNLFDNKLAQAIGLRNDHMHYYLYRDHRTNLEYISCGKDLHDFGMYTSLQGYEYRVYLNFKEVFDTNGSYRNAAEQLNGRGTASVERFKEELQLAPVHNTFFELFSTDNFTKFDAYCFSLISEGKYELITDTLASSLDKFVSEINKVSSVPIDNRLIINNFKDELKALKDLSKIVKENSAARRKPKWFNDINGFLPIFINGKNTRELLFPILVLKNLSAGSLSGNNQSKSIVSKLLLEDNFIKIMETLNHTFSKSENELQLLKMLSTSNDIYNSEKVLLKQKFPDESRKIKKATAPKPKIISREEFLIREIFRLNEEINYLNVNEYQGVTYYHKENFESLINWICILEIIEDANRFLIQRESKLKRKLKSDDAKVKKINKAAELQEDFIKEVKKEINFFSRLKDLSRNSFYQVNQLLKSVITVEKKAIAKKVKKSAVGKASRK